MSKHNFKFIKLIALAFVLLFCSLCTPLVSFADKASELEESIAAKQKEIDAAKKEKSQLSKTLTNIEKVKKNLEKSKADLTAYVTQLDENVAEIQGKIDALNEQIITKTNEIEATKQELATAEQNKATQYERMTRRIQCMYEQGDGYYLELLLTACSISDFLNRLDYMNQISEYDNDMFQEYSEIVEYVSLCKQKLEAEEELLEETKTMAEQEKSALEELIEEKKQEIIAFQTDINNQEKAIREYEAEIEEQTAIIKELEKQVAADRAALASQRNYDGGVFTWPCPSYTRISDDYGYRIHPILKTQQFHTGVDMAAPGGTDILAAYDGVVVAAAYNSSMGNYVMIDHGDELYTIYMHASKLLVSSGDEVKKGQKIALVGSTGRSTGNHLHFSVRLKGSYVSPWGYISKP
ncbi:MAG: peptidoglycan DD-metalloendopeptidase family protein [Lachnospiraceae bacterium]|nr:peptidoglycan DD-metalloendopeptidase family protein [Lachnospiraceae bacterium]